MDTDLAQNTFRRRSQLCFHHNQKELEYASHADDDIGTSESMASPVHRGTASAPDAAASVRGWQHSKQA